MAIPVSRHEEHGSSSTAFAYGHGLMVFFNNMVNRILILNAIPLI